MSSDSPARDRDGSPIGRLALTFLARIGVLVALLLLVGFASVVSLVLWQLDRGRAPTIQILALASGTMLALFRSVVALFRGLEIPRQRSRLLLFHLGLCVLGTLAACIGHSWPAGLWFVLLVAALSDILLLTPPTNAAALTRAAWIYAGVVFAIIGPLIWSFAASKTIEARAVEMAGTDMWCLQEGRYVGYAPTESSDELSLLSLQALFVVPAVFVNGPERNFRIALVVNRGGTDKFYNWSYWRQNFMPVDTSEDAEMAPAACLPVEDFSATLSG